MARWPQPEELYELADELVERHAARDRLYRRMDDLYFQEGEASDEDERVQRVTLPLATNAIDLVADLASVQEIGIEIPAAGESRKAKLEADEQEKWFKAWLSLNERRSRGNFRHQMAWYAAMRGMVVVRVLPDVKRLAAYAETFDLPVVLQLRDPGRVYCDWGPYGLRAVVEEYERSVRSIRREYPGVLAGKEYADRDTVRWREYWDEQVCCYWADGEPVKVGGRAVRPHLYGCLPYGVAYARMTPSPDPERAARPMLAAVERVIENVQVLASIMATAGVHTIDSAFAVYSQRYGLGEGRQRLDLTPGAINYFDPLLGEKVEPIQRPPLPQDLYQLMGLFMTQFQQGTFPAAIYGEVGLQMAVYAISLMTQSGRRALLPIWRAVERAHELAIMACAEIVANLVGPAYGRPLPLVVVDETEDRRRARREIALDWEKIGADFDVVCRLGDPLPADRASNLRMAIEAVRAGLLSQETALTDYNLVEDPTEEMMRIFVERVVAKAIEGEALRVAVERGYLTEEEGRDVGKREMAAGNDVGAGGLPALAPGGGQPLDAASLQQVAGMPDFLPPLEQQAGEIPPELITQAMGSPA